MNRRDWDVDADIGCALLLLTTLFGMGAMALVIWAVMKLVGAL